MEVNKEQPWNPIAQDTKRGALRFYPSPSLVNYGAFPQTWEDPAHDDALVPGTKGDNGAARARGRGARVLAHYLPLSFAPPLLTQTRSTSWSWARACRPRASCTP
jgi:hypothetical protein